MKSSTYPKRAGWRRLLPPQHRFHRHVTGPVFRMLGMYRRGLANVLDVKLVRHEFTLANLPPAFDGWTILYMSDLHIDGVPGLTDALIAQIADVEVDLFLFGGDLRADLFGPTAPALVETRRVLGAVRARHGMFGVRGNHDSLDMLPALAEMGLPMLLNDAHEIRIGDDAMWVVGVDDPYGAQNDDTAQAFGPVPPGAFSIFLAHSPDVYDQAADHGADLYLCGHTHGGQICLPRIGPVLTNSRAPRHLIAGRWAHANMAGFTSRGAGASGVPLRFNCPGEVALITLRRGLSES